jgi:hypothetical protein
VIIESQTEENPAVRKENTCSEEANNIGSVAAIFPPDRFKISEGSC